MNDTNLNSFQIEIKSSDIKKTFEPFIDKKRKTKFTILFFLSMVLFLLGTIVAIPATINPLVDDLWRIFYLIAIVIIGIFHLALVSYLLIPKKNIQSKKISFNFKISFYNGPFGGELTKGKFLRGGLNSLDFIFLSMVITIMTPSELLTNIWTLTSNILLISSSLINFGLLIFLFILSKHNHFKDNVFASKLKKDNYSLSSFEGKEWRLIKSCLWFLFSLWMIIYLSIKQSHPLNILAIISLIINSATSLVLLTHSLASRKMDKIENDF